MPIIDVILLIILGGFVLFGLWFGFIHTLGSLLGVLLGAWLAGRWYDNVAEWGQFLWGNGDIGYVISFILILILVNRVVGLIFYFFDRVFEVVAWLPFLNGINRLTGAVLGFIEGTFSIGLVLFFLARYPINQWISDQLIGSTLAHWFIGITQFIAPLLPAIVRQLEAVI